MNFPFPELRQVYRYDCVALALDCILVASGIEEVREEHVMRIAHTTPRDGTSSAGVIRVHRRFRLPFRVGQLTPDDLCRNVEHWHPTLLFVQAYRDDPEIAWDRCWDQGHGVVCVGFDGRGRRRGRPSCRRFEFEDPSSYSRTYLDERELLRRWHDMDPGRVRLIQWGCTTLVRSKFRPGKIVHMD